MTTPSPARRPSRRSSAWATAALLFAGLVGAPTAAAAAPPSGAGSAEDCWASKTVRLASTTAAAGAPPCEGPTGDEVLSWAPPQLTKPVTVKVTSRTKSLKLDAAKDYVIDLPATPVALSGGLSISGGNDVVLVGGEISTKKRGLYLKNQTGTVHVEGLRLSGEGATEGINLDQRKGATVQLQNIAVETVTGSYSGTHADVLQTWGGPELLRVDRLEGSTTYQGFFLNPTKFHKTKPELFDIRNTVLRDSGKRSAYLLWQSDTFPIRTEDVVVVRNPKKPFPKQVLRVSKGQKSWSGVTEGSASTPSPLIGEPGAQYESPGYSA